MWAIRDYGDFLVFLSDVWFQEGLHRHNEGGMKAVGVLVLAAVAYGVANEAGKFMAHNTSLHPSGFAAG